MFYKLVEKTPHESFLETDAQKALCDLYKTHAECEKDLNKSTECFTDDIKMDFFTKMYFPFRNIWFPTEDQVLNNTDKVVPVLESWKDTMFTWSSTTEKTTSRILSSNVSVTFTISSDGADLMDMGSKSGLDIAGIQIKHFAILSLMIALIFGLN